MGSPKLIEKYLDFNLLTLNKIESMYLNPVAF